MSQALHSYSFQVVRSGIDSYCEQPCNWKVEDTEDALRYWDFEKFLEYGVVLFDEIIEFDEEYRMAVLRGQCKWSEETVVGVIRDAIYKWHSCSSRVLTALAYFEKNYGGIKHADKYRRQVREAQGILTPDEVFFSDEVFVDLRDEAIESHLSGQTIECGAK